MTEEFAAPWSTQLIVTSVVVAIIFLSVVGILLRRLVGVAGLLVGGVLVALFVVMVSYAVVGYRLNDEAITIEQLRTKIEISLDSLQSVEVIRSAMEHSHRLNGRGGAFSFTGRYYNDALGSYRAFVTDPARTVVLRSEMGTVVISPDRPEVFKTSVLRRTRARMNP